LLCQQLLGHEGSLLQLLLELLHCLGQLNLCDALAVGCKAA
jgi:hypothetical protein